jgi:hypothetical protein
MTYQELVTTIKKLSPEQRLSLLELLAQTLRADIHPGTPRSSSLARVRGMLKVDGQLPTDEELSDDYADYLTKKYA